jgi:hypothetical protein
MLVQQQSNHAATIRQGPSRSPSFLSSSLVAADTTSV